MRISNIFVKIILDGQKHKIFHSIFRENGFDDVIVSIKGRIEDVSLPVEKVDAIVSEWMGYFLLFESMLDSLIFARDKYLDKSGIMLPNECNLFICGVSDTGENKL